MNELILASAAAGLVFSALGLSSFALWRSLRTQSLAERKLRDALRQVEESIAAIPAPAALDTAPLQAVREDVVAMGGMLSTLSKAQNELQDALTETVTEAMGAAAAELNAQIADSDKRAGARNEALCDEQQKLAESLEGLGGALAETIRADIAPVTETALAISAQVAALGGGAPITLEGGAQSAPRAAPQSVPRAAADGIDIEPLQAALSEAVAEAVAQHVAVAMATVAETLGEDVAGKLRTALASELAALGGGTSGRRTSSLFNPAPAAAPAAPDAEGMAAPGTAKEA